MPPYFDNKVLIYEWMRNWVQVATLAEDGSILKLDPFLPGNDYISPMDMEVGPKGRLYILEWGDEFWGSNSNAQLVRLDYYGSAEGPARDLPVASGIAVTIHSPPDGGVFVFDEPIEYRVSAHDQALSNEVVVRTYTGFDTSPIPLEVLKGLAGNFTISRAFTHQPDLHYADRFAVLEACLDASCARVKLQPRLKEAEHVADAVESTRMTYSARPASEHWGRTAISVMPVKTGSSLTYAPVNLSGIDQVTLRLRATAPGRIHFSADGSDAALSSVDIGPDVGDPVTPHQAVYAASVPAEASGMNLLRADAYDRWREITVPIAPANGTFALRLTFESEAETTFLELDWIRFDGPGLSAQ